MNPENRARIGPCWNGVHLRFLAVLYLATASLAWGQQERGLSLILVSTETEASEVRARAVAGESFHTLARTYSLDASSAVGGYLGEVGVEDLRPEFQAALASMEAGEVTAVTRVDDRYALLRFPNAGEQSWAQARDSGLDAVRDERYEDAARLFESALRNAREFAPVDSRLGTSLNDLAELRRLQGDLQSAADLYREALAAWDPVLGPGHPDTAATLNSLAEIYLNRGDYAEAAAAFDRSLAIWERELGPGHANVAANLNSLGLIRHVQGDYAEARSLFQRALGIWESALGPDHMNVASALGNLAAVEMIESRHAEAERLIRRSLDIVERTLGPDHPEVARNLRGLAELRGLQGDWAGAANLYERSLGMVWGSVPGAVSEVIEVLDRFVDVLSLPFVSDSQHEASVTRFVETLASAPVGQNLYLAMSDVLAEEGHANESESILIEAAGRFPNSRLVRFRLAELAASRGRIEEALDGLELARELPGVEPGIETILKRRGDLLVDIGSLDQARPAYVEALGIDPAYPEARIGLGNLYFRSGLLEEALAEFSEAALLNPDDPFAHYRVSEASLRLERPAQAAAAADRVLELDPDDRRAHYLRGRALTETGSDPEGLEALAEYARLEERARIENRQLLEVSGIELDVRAAMDRGDSGQAMRILQGGIERHPASYRLSLALGLIQSRSGLPRAAVDTLESMIERGLGDDSVIRRTLAEAYEALNQDSASEEQSALYLQRLHTELEATLPR